MYIFYIRTHSHIHIYLRIPYILCMCTVCNGYILASLMIGNLYYKYAHSSIQHIICNRNVFTNFLPRSHAINPNNETCLVTCAVSLTCATWLCTHSFPLIYPSTRIHYWYIYVCTLLVYVYCMYSRICSYCKYVYTVHKTDAH